MLFVLCHECGCGAVGGWMMRSKSWLLKISPTLTLILKLCKMDDEMPFFILFFLKKNLSLVGFVFVLFRTQWITYI